MDCSRLIRVLGTITLVGLIANPPARGDTANKPPIAEAGLPRYVAKDAVQLDGSGSYDPDHSGPLTYAWTQVSGPPVAITDADTPTPTVSGFVQTDQVQQCEVQLVVSDGELASQPDRVRVVVVPAFSQNTPEQQNPPFDSNKPTVFYFGGGNCILGGGTSDSWGSAWAQKANFITFAKGYAPDLPYRGAPTYYNVGDMMIVFLSKVAPNYEKPIQTVGWSTGGQPAVDAGIRLNRVYRDRRYAVNRVTELDAPCRGSQQGLRAYALSNWLFQTSAVEGEQCWHDHYCGQFPMGENAPRDLLVVWLEDYDHPGVWEWYRDSLVMDLANQFNGGVVAGAYWSVVGPGKNLQLTSQPIGHYFHWRQDKGMALFDEAVYPGRLPQPVTLVGPGTEPVAGAGGTVLSCQPVANAVGYQLLLGAEPDRMAYLVSDTPTPPSEPLASIPFERTWWTVRAYDRYGSTIYADPLPAPTMSVRSQTVVNSRTGRTYTSIQEAINHACEGDEVVVGVGALIHMESLDFKGRSVRLRSTDPNDAGIVASTIVTGDNRAPIVTLSASGGGPPVLEGLTIMGGSVGISCGDANPTIRNCTVGGNGSVAVECEYGHQPRLVNCTLLGEVGEAFDPSLIAHWRLDESEGTVAHNATGDPIYDATLGGNAAWRPQEGHIGGALALGGKGDWLNCPFVLNPAQGPFSVFAWVKGGAPGQVIMSQANKADWLMAAAPGGVLKTALSLTAVPALVADVVITDGQWHWIGLVWDGTQRSLYADGRLVAQDSVAGLPGSDTGLYVGVGSKRTAASYWSGVIDDVRIYDRAMKL
jgi:hypothetical protein